MVGNSHDADAPLVSVARALTQGWELLLTRPGLLDSPSRLPEGGFLPAIVPGTVAAALRAQGHSPLDAPQDLDSQDAWYRCRFEQPPLPAGARARLRFEGLATVADVYLNGVRTLASDSMFVTHVVDVTQALAPSNELAIRFRALGPELKLKKVRPRWKTKLVEQQQLRFFRTTLVGRTPGICPSVAPVGPFRAVSLEISGRAIAERIDVGCRLEEGAGIVSLCAHLQLLGGRHVESASLVVGPWDAALRLTAGDAASRIEGELRVKEPPLWWPHTHGPSPLFDATLIVRLDDATLRQPLGRVGFRSLALDATDGGFGLRINGERVFCRGACWTPADVVGLSPSPNEQRQAVELARDAGMNMIRVGGTMLYEDDAFHDACDALGVLVWQDFMFANMDYPCADEAFMKSARLEAEQIVARLARRPSTAVFCGNSEVEQQAAMLGLPRDAWANELFSSLLPAVVRSAADPVPYWPSSPSGGALPFQVSAGVSHYYGVGAYERPFEDARRANVRFTAECLAFANVPEPATLDKMSRDGAPPPNHPLWKARVARDRGAGWDFDDVRDHYFERIFGISSREARYADVERYLALSRVVTGEAMRRVFSEWRRPGSSCQGGLVWLFRDWLPGAGWGVVDATGCPKAAYWYLRRALQPRALFVSDEGLDGLVLHVVNEHGEPLRAKVGATLYRTVEVTVAARGGDSVPLQSRLESFVDTTYAYRFGPPSHDLVVVTLDDAASGERLSSDFYFPLGMPSGREMDVGLDAAAMPEPDGTFSVDVSTKRFAQSVWIDLKAGTPDDNHFHLAPGERKRIRVRSSPGKLEGTVRALNAHREARIRTA